MRYAIAAMTLFLCPVVLAQTLPAPVVAPATLPAATSPSVKRLAVPDAEDRAKAQKLIEQLHAADIRTSKTGAEKKALAEKFLKTAKAASGDPGQHFMLMLLAARHAVQAKDLSMAENIANQVSDVYATEGVTVLLDAVDTTAKDLKKPLDFAELATLQMEWSDRHDFNDDWVLQRRAADVVEALANRSEDDDLKNDATLRKRHVAEAQKAFEAAEHARGLLQTTPNDLSANLTVGRYECFIAGNWETGLPMLVAGSDQRLKQLAEMELGKHEPVAVADGWWDLATAETEFVRASIFAHSARLYSQVMPRLSGLNRTKAIQRIRQFNSSCPHDQRVANAEFLIEALIDGNSEFRITPRGFYWMSHAGAAKPGRANDLEVPTYIDDRPWIPIWGKESREGEDRSSLYAIPLEGKFAFELIGVGTERGGATIEARDAVQLRQSGTEQSLVIRDTQPEARWYRIKLMQLEPQAPKPVAATQAEPAPPMHAREGLSVLVAASLAYPDRITNMDALELFRFHDGSTFNRNGGTPQSLEGSYSTSPVVGRHKRIWLWGIYEKLPAGKYVVIYRIRSSTDLSGNDACRLDIAKSGKTMSQYRPKAAELPAEAWREVPVAVTLNAETTIEYRLWTHGHEMALDRLYVYRVTEKQSP